MKALGVLESKWNPIRQKIVRRLLEEQDKVLRSYFAQKGGTRVQRGEALMAKVGSMSRGTCTCEARTESVRNQDAWPRGVQGMSGEGFSSVVGLFTYLSCR